jgi:hypothetical protein
MPFTPTPDTRADAIVAGAEVYFPTTRRYHRVLKVEDAPSRVSLIVKLEQALAFARTGSVRDARVMAGYAQDDARSLEAGSEGKLAFIAGRAQWTVAPEELVAVRR